jgi:hypothetical protein
MLKILEKIKNFFSGKFVWWPKKKEEPKLQQGKPKAEEKPEEQE